MISLSDVSFWYKKKSEVFSGLNLSLVPGGIYGLLGKNGAGKTTLLNIIVGMLFVKNGNIQVFGFNPKQRNPRMLADLFFLPEVIRFPSITIARYVDQFACFYPKFDHVEFLNYLKQFGLTLNDKINSISYGEKKKFLISFGIASKTRVLVMDEPTNGLDIPSKTIFRKLIASIADIDRIILISTHQIRDLENLIDPIIILDEGKIVLNESLESISKTISIGVVNCEAQSAGAIYCEKNMSGYTIVKTKDTMLDENVDLESLFNAAISNPAAIRQLFSTKKEGMENGN